MTEVDAELLADALKRQGLHEYAGRAVELAGQVNEARRMDADASHPAQIEDFYDERGRNGYVADVSQGEAFIRWLGHAVATMPLLPPEGQSIDPLVSAVDKLFDLPPDVSAMDRVKLIDAIRAAGAKINAALSDERFKLIIKEGSQGAGRPREADPDLQLLIGVAYRFIHPNGQSTASGDRRSIQPIIIMTLALCDVLNLDYDPGRVKLRLGEIYLKLESGLPGDKDARALYLTDINNDIFDPAEAFDDWHDNNTER